MASSTLTKNGVTFYTVNVSGSVSSSTGDTATISWSSNVKFGDWYWYGVGLKTYVAGSQVKDITGYTSASYGTCCSSSGTKTISKTHSAQTITISASSYSTTVSGYGGVGSTTSASLTVTVPAKTSYTVSYNANGGSSAPSSQTKWYGETLTLSSTKPTRDGYTFAGWGTSASATGVSYSAGGSYTSNAAITLYAVWIDNKSVCTIAYDANGGSGAPSSQSHVQSTVSKLSGVKPTKDGYVFLGWSLKSYSTKATWIANGRYAYDDFADGDTITLYAVWKRVDRIWINVPDGTSVSAIHVKVPDGSSLNDVYFRIEETYITTSDGATLADSSGNYLILKDG